MISEYDFDQLSAYLDDQLVPAEKAALEARLAAESELRMTLRELRLTVRALRALPPVALPRSFVLTPAQVAQARPTAPTRLGQAAPARRPLAPALRLAAAFSAVALALVVFTDLRGGAFLNASPSADVAGQAVMATTLPAEAPQDPAPAASETPLGEDGTSILGFASIAPTATPDAAGDAAGTGPAATEVTVESSAELLPGPTPTELGPTATPDAERNAATPAPEDTLSTKSAGLAPSATPLSVAAVPPPEATDATLDVYAQTAPPDAAPQPAAPPLSGVRVLELGLALLTALLGLAAWLTRRAA